jgi:hypothetical protein
METRFFQNIITSLPEYILSHPRRQFYQFYRFMYIKMSFTIKTSFEWFDDNKTQ